MGRTWTISELAAEAAALLADDGPVANGRVRDLPNERLIRWYTTIGLVDPPLARRGRTSIYGQRHLLQLIAVKRRQAAGLTIAEIQAELAGATDGLLASSAGVPAEEAGDTGPPARADRFWAKAPAPPKAPAPAHEPAATTVQSVSLAPGVTLLLETGAALDPAHLTAITAAARPLIDELTRLGHPQPARRPV